MRCSFPCDFVSGNKMNCRFCDGQVSRPRRTFCSDRCVHEWRMRSSRSYARYIVWLRDQGICEMCGVDTNDRATMIDRANQLGRRFPSWRRTLWDMHHKTAVYDNGGNCGIDGLATYCIFCHQDMTAYQHESRIDDRYGWWDMMSQDSIEEHTE